MATTAAFDTRKAVDLLCSSLSPRKSAAIVKIFNELLSVELQKIHSDSMVKKQLSNTVYSHRISLSFLKLELQENQKSDFVEFRNSLTRLQALLEENIKGKGRTAFMAIRSKHRYESVLEKATSRQSISEVHFKINESIVLRIQAEIVAAKAAVRKLQQEVYWSLTGFLLTAMATTFGFMRLIQ